jgi:hypothetical protein
MKINVQNILFITPLKARAQSPKQMLKYGAIAAIELAAFMMLPVTVNSQCPTFNLDANEQALVQSSRIYFSAEGDAPQDDQDLDFLKDEFEYKIASFFKPYLWGYGGDDSFWGSTENPEPVVLFQVSPINLHYYREEAGFDEVIPEVREDEVYLAITYTNLWTEDAGSGDYPYSFEIESACLTTKESLCFSVSLMSCEHCCGSFFPGVSPYCCAIASQDCQCAYPTEHELLSLW